MCLFIYLFIYTIPIEVAHLALKPVYYVALLKYKYNKVLLKHSNLIYNTLCNLHIVKIGRICETCPS